jgi:hypothetical protein
MGDWNHFKITQTIPDQHTGKALSQGTTKTAILGTARVLKKALNQNYNTLNMGYYITCNINCDYRIATTLYTLETWSV